jgi:hypothetical protein
VTNIALSHSLTARLPLRPSIRALKNAVGSARVEDVRVLWVNRNHLNGEIGQPVATKRPACAAIDAFEDPVQIANIDSSGMSRVDGNRVDPDGSGLWAIGYPSSGISTARSDNESRRHTTNEGNKSMPIGSDNVNAYLL